MPCKEYLWFRVCMGLHCIKKGNQILQLFPPEFFFLHWLPDPISLHAAVCVGGDAFQPKTQRKKSLEKQPVHRKHVLGTANVSCTVPASRSGRALLHHSSVGGQHFPQELMLTRRPAGENEDQPVQPHQHFPQL